MKKALSLIEVCIAIVIVSIVLVSMVGIFSQGYRYLRKSRTRTGAYNLAKGIMEQYSDWATLDKLNSISCTEDGIVANNTYNSTNQPACSQYVFNNITLNNNITYTPQLNITDGPSFPTELKQLNVTINWTESWTIGDPNKRVTLYTLKANY